ncbi:hypothetical protein [Streptomyces asiaticus]|uniref:hypothetical protein n=1 Tax=Streptomyces asiaticus TaxID=114695 RepID=UPI003F682029
MRSREGEEESAGKDTLNTTNDEEWQSNEKRYLDDEIVIALALHCLYGERRVGSFQSIGIRPHVSRLAS